MKKSFNIQKLLHCKSKRRGTKPMHPSSSRAFQRHQEYDLKHLGLVDLITIKQNKLLSFILSFIDRYKISMKSSLFLLILEYEIYFLLTKTFLVFTYINISSIHDAIFWFPLLFQHNFFGIFQFLFFFYYASQQPLI
jgi:hypothetical protein